MEQPTKKLKSFRSWDDLEAAQVEHQEFTLLWLDNELSHSRGGRPMKQGYETFWQPQRPM
jgi:hypothetical protein